MLISMDLIKVKMNWNLRNDSETELDTLMKSMQRSGQLHPIVVNDGYELLAGHRRYYAAKNLGWTEIGVKIVDLDADLERLVHLDENLERKDLNMPEREKALAEKFELYKKLVADGVKEPGDFCKETIDQTGLSKSAIYRGIQRHNNSSDQTWDAFTSEKLGSVQLDEMIKLPKKLQDKVISKVLGSSLAETKATVNEELSKINVPAEFAVKHPKLGTIHADKYAKLFTAEAEKMLDLLSCIDEVKDKIDAGQWDSMMGFVVDMYNEIDEYVS